MHIQEIVIIKRLILAIVLASLVGLLVFFVSNNPSKIEIGIASAILVFLISSQVYFIAQRSKSKPRISIRNSPRFADAASSAKKPEKAKDSSYTDKIDPAIFSKFQKNIDHSEKVRSEIDQAEEEVVVSISSKGKKAVSGIKPALGVQGTIPAKSTTDVKRDTPLRVKPEKELPSKLNPLKKDAVPEVPIGQLFDDIQEPLAKPESDNSIPKKQVEKVTDSPLVTESDDTEPIMANEILTSDDLKPDEAEDIKDEAELVFSVAQKQFQIEDYQGAISTVGQFLGESLTKLSNPEMIQKLIQLKGECEFQLKQYNRASKTWNEIFQKFVTKTDAEFLPLLEETINKFKNVDQQQHAVHFLFTALNEYRQSQDLNRMDDTYHEIEDAYQQHEDWKRLIQTYQNHLTIKRTLKDYQGQLEILDHLGKLLYDQGDAEGSKKCYEQRLAIETQMKKA